MNIKYRHALSHLAAADIYSANSHAKRLKVGAVLMKGDTPISLGWNGRLPGQSNECEDVQPDGSLKTRLDVRHAEINALNKLHRSNESALNAVMFCTHAACIQCAADMVQAGIRAFVYTYDYRDREGIKYLLDNGVKVYRKNNGDGERLDPKDYPFFEIKSGETVSTFDLPRSIHEVAAI